MKLKHTFIFLCTDDFSIIEMAKTILSVNGFTFEFCNNGSNAFETIKELNPDLVLLDISLPNLGGDVIARNLKKDESRSHIPVILFSSLNITEEIAKKVKAEGFLRKPFSVANLEKSINEVLSGSLAKREENLH